MSELDTTGTVEMRCPLCGKKVSVAVRGLGGIPEPHERVRHRRVRGESTVPCRGRVNSAHLAAHRSFLAADVAEKEDRMGELASELDFAQKEAWNARKRLVAFDAAAPQAGVKQREREAAERALVQARATEAAERDASDTRAYVRKVEAENKALRALLEGRENAPSAAEDEAARVAGINPHKVCKKWHFFDAYGSVVAAPAVDAGAGEVK